MCDRSYSGFTPYETPFLTLIDLSTNLIPKKIYDAGNPTRLSETIHWRTVSELIKYNEIRGLISGEIIPQHKIGIVDSVCDLTRDYISCPEWGK